MTGETLQRVEIRGTERFMSWGPKTCFKIVHTMLLSGSTSAIDGFMAHVPEALQLTFNRHPRMRLREVQGEFAIGEVHPKLALQDIHDQELLHVRTVDSQDEMSDTVWHGFVQQQAVVAFDRVNAFSFELHAWVDRASGLVRLFLFSDHFTSDGNSGNAILNDVLLIASALTRNDQEDLARVAEELPLRGAMYQQTFNGLSCVLPVIGSIVSLAAKSLFRPSSQFVPLIKPRAEHQRFSSPPPNNPSTLLFATGSPENLARLLQRCREEKTTFFGALSAATLLGLAHVADAPRDHKFHLVMNFALDMRSRLAEPVEKGTVGVYAIGGEVTNLMANGGIDLNAVSFWDAARSIKQEAEESATSFAVTSLPLLLMDLGFHSKTRPSAFENTSITEYACSSDANVSSVGQYAYPTTHTLVKGSEAESLTVQSLHINCRTPFIAPLSQFYVTSVASGGIGYGLNHHLEPAVGQRVLDAVVAILENAWRVTSSDSLATVLDSFFLAAQG